MTFAMKQEMHITSVAMETQQIVVIHTVELHGAVSNIIYALFLM
jgi:hypothetical protein